MGKFKEFLKNYMLNESFDISEDDFSDKKNMKDVDKIIDNDRKVQDLIDDINDELDSEESLEESMITEGSGVPFDVEGTFYDGGTDERVEMSKSTSDGLNESDENAETEEMITTDTFKFLNKLKDNPPSMDEIRSNFQLFRINNGKLQKRQDKFFGNYADMSDKDMEDLVNFVNNRRILRKNVFEIDDDGTVQKTVMAKNRETGEFEVKKAKTSIKNPRVMDRICKLLNTLYSETMPDKLFWWENKGTGKDKILTISKDDLKKNKNNDKLHDFKDVEYVPLSDKTLRDDVSQKLEYSLNKKKIKDQSFLEYKDGKLFKDGNPMTEEEFKSFIHDRNGMPNPTDDYWETYKFLAEGSKIGKTVGSFSLPPGTTCITGVPCAHQGCYAYRSFRNPTVRACWFANLGKLQEGVSKDGKDRFKQFEEECIGFIQKHKLTHFRFHVSGDVDIGANKGKYIASICNIASKLGDVKFWTYTKDYAAWESASVPSNLVVILSAWGKFRPNQALTEKHPVAFLYDKEDPEIMKYMEGIDPAHFDEYESGGKDDPVVFCPCSDPTVKENVTCDRCQICFTRSAHHNVAFHKH